MMALHLMASVLALAGIGCLLEAIALRSLTAVMRQISSLRTLSWVLTGVAVAYVVSLRFPAALVPLAVAIMLGRRTPHGYANVDRPAPQRMNWAFVTTMVIMSIWIAARPLIPMAWDEFVWVSKAQIEAGGDFGALTAAALVPGQEVFPAGYPLLWSLIPAWLVGSEDLAGLSIGFTCAKLVFLMAFLLALRALWTSPQPDRKRNIEAVLFVGIVTAIASPLFIAHVRLLYADAPVGMLAAALTLTLITQSRSTRICQSRTLQLPLLAPSLAIILVGLKDEGFLHVLAITLAGIVRGNAALRRTAGLTLAVSAVIVFSWRMQLADHGITNVDHAIERPAFAMLWSLLTDLAGEATDPMSWGILWPLTLAAASMLLLMRSPRGPHEAGKLTSGEARFVASVWISQLVMFQTALLMSTERVKAFALGGTLFNRMLVQLTPTAALVLLAALDALVATGRLRSMGTANAISPTTDSLQASTI